MSDMIFSINPNGSNNVEAINNSKQGKKNCTRPGGFLWGSRGLSCTCAY